MRVVAGELRGRRLVAPLGDATRPTTDQAREAVFNSLRSLDVIEGALVADLYAGSGALGIEALSRGAAHVTFVERDRHALAAIRANLEALGLTGSATVVPMDVDAWLASGSGTRGGFDLVFADPPYDFADWARLLGGVSAALVVAESGRALEPVTGWEIRRAKRYGRTHVALVEPRADTVPSP